MINKGPVFLLAQVVAVPFAYWIVAYVIIPRFMRQRVTSAYELLFQLGRAGRASCQPARRGSHQPVGAAPRESPGGR